MRPEYSEAASASEFGKTTGSKWFQTCVLNYYERWLQVLFHRVSFPRVKQVAACEEKSCEPLLRMAR